MAEPRGFLLLPEFADDLAAMLAWFKSQYRNPSQPQTGTRPTAGVNVQRIKVTDSAPIDTVAGMDYFPGRPQTWDPTTAAWADAVTDDSLAVFDPSGGSLAEDDQVWGRSVAPATLAMATWPTFAVLSGGGSGVEQIKITGTFYQDDGGATACSGSSSPLCYYPGKIQSLTCSGWADGEDVWVVFWFGQAAVPGSPPTVVKVDGSAAHTAIYAGFSYAPTGGGSRRVFRSTEAAWGWAIGCGDVGGGVQGPILTLAG